MNKQYKILTASLAVSMSLLFSGCGTKDKTEKDTPAISSQNSKESVEKEEKIVQPKEDSEKKDSSAPAAEKSAGANSGTEDVRGDSGITDEENKNDEPDSSSDENMDKNIDTNKNAENQEVNLIQNCGFVIEADRDAQTMLIAEGWEEAPPSVIEARETGVSYYIGDATINCPCQISSGLVVYFTYYIENGVNIVTEITSDGDEKEPRLDDYDYEYPEN